MGGGAGVRGISPYGVIISPFAARVTVSDLFHMVLDLFQDPAARILPIGTIISPSGTITLPARMLRFGVKIESRKSESESNVDSRVLGL